MTSKLTQARKISFINTILFRSHIHYDGFLGYLVWAYKLQKMGKMIDAIQYFLLADKKISDSAFSELDTVSFSLQNWYSSAAFRITVLVAATSLLAYPLTTPQGHQICSFHDWFQSTPKWMKHFSLQNFESLIHIYTDLHSHH